MSSLLYAQTASSSGQAASNPIMSFLPLIFLFVIFYFFLIRPQQKKMKEHQNMVNNLQKGDKIITAGGIYGIVDSFKTDDQNAIYIKIAENTKILLTKDSVAKVIIDYAIDNTKTISN